MTTDTTAERERLAELLLWLERASDALQATRAGLDRYAETGERLADWQACAPVLRQPVPNDARDDAAAAFAHLLGATYRLRDASQHVAALCRSPADDLLARWCRGCGSLADTIARGLTTRDALAAESGGVAVVPKLDLERIAAIIHGLNLVTERIGREAAADARAHLREHEREVDDWRALGQHRLAEQLDGGDPGVARALAVLRELAGEGPARVY